MDERSSETIRRGLAVAAALLLCTAPIACGTSGGGGRSTTTQAMTSLPEIETKMDDEHDSDAYPGEPDNESRPFGQPASAADTRAVAVLIHRYYSAVAANDGSAGCRLLYEPVAESAVEDYGYLSGSRGSTCAAVLSKAFRQHKAQVRAGVPTVSAVRVRFTRGAVQLAFDGGRSLRYTLVRRERGRWKLNVLFDIAKPAGAE